MPDRTRLAPSPTGPLHLGNARTFAINWALARKHGWRVLLRIEDLDAPRVRPGANQLAIDVLQWLGLRWDEGPVYQFADLSPYHAALKRLAETAMIYPCTCTRSRIASAQSAPHADEHEQRYPGTCRPPAGVVCPYDPDAPPSDTAWRVRVNDDPIAFHDVFAGPQSFNLDATTGDFIVASKNGLPAYQLAVVVDDARQGVTQIVRGDDLLGSTPRQLWLYRLLGLHPVPQYTHVPLVVGPDGRRLAKRHGDTRLVAYRDAGVDPRRVIGLIAHWCGEPDRRPMTAEDFALGLDLARLSADRVMFTPDDHAWLLDGRVDRRTTEQSP